MNKLVQVYPIEVEFKDIRKRKRKYDAMTVLPLYPKFENTEGI